MHHVIARYQQFDAGAFRHDHRVIYCQQTWLARLQIGLIDHIAIKGNAFVRIGVVPIPLIAGNLDHHVSFVGTVHVIKKTE